MDIEPGPNREKASRCLQDWWRLLRMVAWTLEKKQDVIYLHSAKKQCSFCHIMQEDNNLDKLMLLGKVDGNRPKDQMLRRWTDQITKISQLLL